MKTKTCTKCKIEKELSEFHKNKAQKDGYVHWCKKCICNYKTIYNLKNKTKLQKYQKTYNTVNKKILREKQKEYRDNNKDKRKISRLACYFNISKLKATQLYNKKLNGICEICKKPESSKRFLLSVDHNHTTGKIRGLLCNNCNKALGGFKDSIKNLKNLENAIIYLKKDTLCQKKL